MCRTCTIRAALILRTGYNEGVIIFFTVVESLAGFLRKPGSARGAPGELKRSPEGKSIKEVSYIRYQKHKVKNRK
jgi:hypothetical protein